MYLSLSSHESQRAQKWQNVKNVLFIVYFFHTSHSNDLPVLNQFRCESHIPLLNQLLKMGALLSWATPESRLVF